MEMKKRFAFKVCCSVVLFLVTLYPGPARSAAAESDFAAWYKNPEHSSYFPIAVWLQDPKNAERYKAAGINLYVGLWRGPDSNQLQTLGRAGMFVICHQNSFALEQKDNPTIAGWMHGDEPDNAQSLGKGKGYGPPIKPEVIVQDYEKIRRADPSRPVLLNLGQAVAWDNYIGRGVRRNHPEDYPEYVKGCDIASFDIYPVVHEAPEIRGKLEYVARGVDRLREWAGGKMVWNCIECTHISEPTRKATPAQVRSEVWMSLIHGSRGLIYFVHEFEPAFKEAGLLADPGMLQAVTGINRQITELAPVLNRPTLTNVVSVTSSAADVPIATMNKEAGGDRYLFAVAMRPQKTRGTFTFASKEMGRRVEVMGESRTLDLADGRFSDDFAPYEVHLYRIAGGAGLSK